MDHFVFTSDVMGYWRSNCTCGWRKQFKTRKAMTRHINLHLDEQAASSSAAQEGDRNDA